MSPRLDYRKPREREPYAVKEVSAPLTPEQLVAASKDRKAINQKVRKAEKRKRQKKKAKARKARERDEKKLARRRANRARLLEQREG